MHWTQGSCLLCLDEVWTASVDSWSSFLAEPVVTLQMFAGCVAADVTLALSCQTRVESLTAILRQCSLLQSVPQRISSQVSSTLKEPLLTTVVESCRVAKRLCLMDQIDVSLKQLTSTPQQALTHRLLIISVIQ